MESKEELQEQASNLKSSIRPDLNRAQIKDFKTSKDKEIELLGNKLHLSLKLCSTIQA